MSGYVRQLALAARAAQAAVAACDAATRRALIVAMAAQLEARLDVVLRANADDLRRAATAGAGKAVLDRLLLDAGRVRGMAAALREVAAQPDPLGAITRSERRPNGIMVERQRIPLGLVAMIYEARPNVTAEAAALCLKAGNAVLLRGGSEAAASNAAIAACLHAALRDVGMPEAAVSLVADTAREHVLELLQLTDLVDLAIPRGGESLIRFVAEHARVPVIKHYKGVCHLYVDRAADIGTAIGLLIDGKVSRPGVCNALETLLVHRDIAEEFLPPALAALRAHAVEVRCDARTRAIDAGVGSGLRRRIPRPGDRGTGGGLARPGHRAHPPVRLRPYRGHCHRGSRRGRRLRPRDPQLGGHGQCQLALQRRRPAGAWRGDRDLHHPPARLRPDGRRIADHRALRGARRGPAAAAASGDMNPRARRGGWTRGWCGSIG